MRFYCTSTGFIGGLDREVLLYFNWSHRWSIVRFYFTSTGPIRGLDCKVLLYFNWSHRWSQL